MAAWILLSIVLTGIITAFLFARVLQKAMIVPVKSRYGFEETCRKLEEAVQATDEWGFPISHWEFYQSQLKKNLRYENIKNCRIYFVCKPSYANMVVREDPKWTGIMPCSWAVYETKNGDTYIAKMNIPLMSKMFTGRIGETMKKVAEEEKGILEAVEAK